MSLYRKHVVLSALLLALTMPVGVLLAAEPASDTDKAFVAKVSQGGMFEVELGNLASTKGSTQQIRDNGFTEAHDHDLVGAKLKSVSNAAGLEFPSKLNSEFQGKLDKLSTLTGHAFDEAYVAEMNNVHHIDGGLFAQEAKGGGSSAFRDFAGETHGIVEMHLGALKGTGIK